MQINRLFEITYILLNKGTVTAKELAERFNVSARTIYRDIDTLSLAGIPVYTQMGKSGGISLLPDFVLNKSILSEKEQNEILSALQSFSVIKAGETDRVLKKLSGIFNKNAVPWLEVDFSDWGFESGNAFLNFKTAVLERRVAEFDYYSASCEMTHRQIEPVSLWFKSKSWYVKGFCKLKKEMRLFKLSRVRNLIITDERFLERDYSENVDSEFSGLQKPDITLKLKIAPEMTFRLYDDFCEQQVEKQPDGYFIVTVTWPDGEWLYGMILSYGEYIEVLEPESVREIIKEKSHKIAKKYP